MELLSHRKIDSGPVNKNTTTGAIESVSEDDPGAGGVGV